MAQDRLGGLPQNVANRAFSTRRSADRLLQQADRPVPDTEFFALALGGAEVVGFGLTNGRVTRLVYHYRDLPQLAILHEHRQRLRRFIDENASPQWSQLTHRAGGVRIQVHSRIRPDDKTGRLEMKIHPVDWYLLHNEVSPNVERAMRRDRLEKGMTRHEAELVLGPPDREKTLESGARVLHWEEYRQTEPREAVVKLGDTAIRIKTGTGKKVKTRTIVARMTEGQVNAVTDTRHEADQPDAENNRTLKGDTNSTSGAR